MFTYLIIFLIIIIPYLKIKKRGVLLILKYDFLLLLHNPKFSKFDILTLEDKYPYFFEIVKKFYDISSLDILFEDIENNSKPVEKLIGKELYKEFELISKKGSKSEKKILSWYILLNFKFYLYKNPYKYIILNLISKVLPKKQYKKIEEKEKNEPRELCII